MNNSELIARLRNTPNWQRESYGDWKNGTLFYDRAPFEAADALQSLERVPMTTADMVNVVKAAGWPTDTNDRQLVAAFNLIEATEAHHGITPPERKG